MILIRRLVTIPLALVFFALMLIAVLLLAVNDRFLQSNAYPQLLADAEVYTFVMGPLLTSALNEAREVPSHEFSDDLSDNPLVLTGLTTEEISGSLNRAFPPDWTQNLVETSFDQIGGYIRGDRDEFTVQVQAGEQVKIIVAETQALLSKAEAYNLLYDEGVDPFLEESVQGRLPLDVQVSVERLAAAARRIIPPDWIQENFEAILDEVTPYMVGDTDSFSVNVQFDDRVAIAAEELKDILAGSDAYSVVYDEVIEPRVRDVLGESVELPVGIAITEAEVVAAMRDVAPVSWVQDQAEGIIDASVPYMIGRTDRFTISIDLTENKAATSRQINALLLDKIEALLDLPTCTRRQLLDLAGPDAFSEVPDCIPPGMTVDELAQEVVLGIGDELQALVIDPLPDTVEFTQATLRSQLVTAGGQDSVDRLDDIRELMSDGFTYTDTDLKEDLVGNDIMSLEGFEDIRSFLSDGWSYTSEELENEIEEAGGTRGIDNFQRVRENFARANTFRWLVYLPMAAILVIIGMLGGRRWRSRFAWAGAFLTVGAAIAFIAAGPVYDSFGQPRIDDLKEELRAEIQESGIYFVETRALAADKAIEIAEAAADDFRNSMFAGSRNLLIAGLAILGLSIGWGVLTRPFRRSKKPARRAAGPVQTDYSDVFREAKQEADSEARRDPDA